MNKDICSICQKHISTEGAPILAMGGFGNPRCLCEQCSADIDCATRGKDPTEISAAAKRIVDNMQNNQIEDPITVKTVTRLLAEAAARRKEIKDGTYDFALDDVEDEGALEEIPEDMLESEEDRRLDAEEEERVKRIDSVLNWVWVVMIVGMIGFMVWWFFFR